MSSDDAEPASKRTNRVFYGITLKVLSVLCFVAMMLLVKLMVGKYPTGQIVFGRSFFGVLPVLIVVLIQGKFLDAFRTQKPGGHMIRSLAGCTAMFLWFAALAHIALPDATAISFGAPFMVVVLAAVFLREQVRAYRWAAVILGFLGVLVVLWPNLGQGFSSNDAGQQLVLLGVSFALASTVFWATAQILVRQLTETENTTAIVTYFSLTCALVALCTAPFGWVMPTLEDALLVVVMGVLGGFGQLFISEAFRHADASILAPFDYLLLIFSSAAAAYFFNEIPGWHIYLGGSIVAGAGLFVIYRERQLGKDRAAERRASTMTKR